MIRFGWNTLDTVVQWFHDHHDAAAVDDAGKFDVVHKAVVEAAVVVVDAAYGGRIAAVDEGDFDATGGDVEFADEGALDVVAVDDAGAVAVAVEDVTAKRTFRKWKDPKSKRRNCRAKETGQFVRTD